MARAASGYHGSQQTSVPMGPKGVSKQRSEVAGSEVELLVVERVVGDVHLAIQAEDRAVRADTPRCCDTAPRAALESDAMITTPSFAREAPKGLVVDRGRLGEREKLGVLSRQKYCGRNNPGADHLRSTPERPRAPSTRTCEVLVSGHGAGHLHQTDAESRVLGGHSAIFIERSAVVSSPSLRPGTRAAAPPRAAPPVFACDFAVRARSGLGGGEVKHGDARL